MPADEVTHGIDVDESRVRTGPRHAAPKKPLFTRFHMPAGKAIASVAMPTAVLIGMGFTSSLALADNNDPPSSKSLTADEYKDCVAALDDAKDASSSPSPSASASASESADAEDSKKSESADDSKAGDTGTDTSADPSADSSSDKGSSTGSGDEKTEPEPSASSEPSASGAADTATTEPSPSDSKSDSASDSKDSADSKDKGNLIDKIGGAIKDVFTGGDDDKGSTESASPSPSATPSASPSESSPSADTKGGDTAEDTVKDTVDKTTKTVGKTVKDTTDTASEAAGDATEEAGTATASPSASASDDASEAAKAAKVAADCPAATEDESGIDNKTPLADDPWYLSASSLTLKSADYQGIVEVKTANGTKKKVLKYVVSGGTDIGDMHQTVEDKQSGKTYHVQAGSGTTSKIRNGDTVMYTEKISGNLFGLIPVTFSPDSPPPLNIPLIYFTKVKVVQAAQFGGTLHIPGMHVYTTD